METVRRNDGAATISLIGVTAQRDVAAPGWQALMSRVYEESCD